MKTVVCVASGESLTQADVDYCRDRATVAVVNDNYKRAPWAELLYATDFKWWQLNIDHVRATFEGKMLTVDEEAAARFGIPWVRGVDKPGISRRRDVVHTNNNSGAALLNVVRHIGAQRILLLGYDMQGEHWFGKHPKELNATFNDFEMYLAGFPAIARDLASEGIEVVNCSRATALLTFPRMSIEEALP